MKQANVRLAHMGERQTEVYFGFKHYSVRYLEV